MAKTYKLFAFLPGRFCRVWIERIRANSFTDGADGHAVWDDLFQQPLTIFGSSPSLFFAVFKPDVMAELKFEVRPAP
jgi:hypothetical protein